MFGLSEPVRLKYTDLALKIKQHSLRITAECGLTTRHCFVYEKLPLLRWYGLGLDQLLWTMSIINQYALWVMLKHACSFEA